MNFHDFNARDIKGQEKALADYAGKLVLVVNTASGCGFTPQYAGLQALQESFPDDLVVLGFPCNQFGGQEPGTEAEIADFCDLSFGVSFPLFSKVDVNGDTADPLFVYLKDATPNDPENAPIKWNFAKFLIGRDGVPIARYLPNVKPEDLEGDIRAALGG